MNALRVVLTGDVFLGGTLLPFLAAHALDFDYPFRPIKAECVDADLVFANLESPLSNLGRPRRDKDFVLRAPPEAVVALKALNVNVACIGNNHICDYGQEGLTSTITLLQRNQIHFVGAGRNREEAKRPLTLNIKGLSIIVLARVECPGALLATPRKGGVIPCNPSQILSSIKEARELSDFVLVSFHWGKEDYAYPSPAQVELAHRAIDAGADVIIGHHSHVVQGIERYKHGIIFYSLGNFFFPDFHAQRWDRLLYRWPVHTRKGLLVQLEIASQGIRNVELVPVYTDSAFQVQAMRGQDQSAFLVEIKKLSEKLNGPGYPRFWRAYDANQPLVSGRSPYKGIWERARQHGVKETLKKLSLIKMLRTSRDLVKYTLLLTGSRLKQVGVRLERDGE